MKVKSLSIRQPWLNAIPCGMKLEENRKWQTSFRGLLALHAGLTLDRPAFARWPQFNARTIRRGAVLGVVELYDVLDMWDDDRGCPYFAWQVRHPRWLREPVVMKGKLSLFDVEIDEANILPAGR